MPLHCAAYGCKSRQGCCDTKISFHRFPLRNPLLLKKWLCKIRRKDWEPTIYSRLCGKHFTSEDYFSKGGRKFLKQDVAPSVFSFSSNFTETSFKDASINQKDLKLTSDNMPACAAVNCSYKPCRHKIPGKSIHRFPFSRPDILRQWIKNVRRKNWKPSLFSVLCNSHFEEECFNRKGCIIRLKSDAVPTIFDYSSAATKDQVFPKCKEIALNTRDLLDTHLLSSKLLEKAKVKNKSPPVLSEESPNCIQKSDHNYCSFSEIYQDSESDQTEEHAAEPGTIHLNENQKSNLNKSTKLSFKKLGKRLKTIKKPSKWWGFTRHCTFIMCTKWNESYAAERKIVIDRKFNVKVFLYNSEVTNPELKRLQSVEDLTKILHTVDRYHIMSF